MNNSSQTNQEPMVYVHPFSDSGLGPAPFRVVGYHKMVLPNGDNFMQAEAEQRMRPKCCVGSCAHCGTGILHHYIIRNADGDLHAVGCDCVAKTGDAKLITQTNALKRQAERAARLARAKEKHEARVQRHLERLEAERKLNGGATQNEVTDAYQMNERRDALLAWKAANPKMDKIGQVLADGKQGFADSIAMDIDRGKLPTGRARAITIEIMAKKMGRKNSKAYHCEFAAVTSIFDNTKSLKQ